MVMIRAVENTHPENVHDSQNLTSNPERERWYIVTVDTLEHLAKDTTPPWIDDVSWKN